MIEDGAILVHHRLLLKCKTKMRMLGSIQYLSSIRIHIPKGYGCHLLSSL